MLGVGGGSGGVDVSQAETTRTQTGKKKKKQQKGKGQDKQTNKQTDANESDPLRRVPASDRRLEGGAACVCVF